MKKICLFFAFLLIACGDQAPSDDGSNTSDSTACMSSATSLSLQQVELRANGIKREYLITVPSVEAGVKMPMIIAIHGGDGRNYPFPQQQQFESLSTEEGVIIVYPLSDLVQPNEGEWQLNTADNTRQDIDFIEALIDHVSSNICVDPQRIYATGYSLGSMFNYELACHLNSRFAAIASHAGTMPVEPNSCLMEKSVPIMHLHGADDFIIAYDKEWEWKEWDSVGTMRDIPSLLSFWRGKYNCTGENETATTNSTHFVYSDCDEGVRVEHHRINNGGHEWPQKIDKVSTHKIIWNFLSEFKKK